MTKKISESYLRKASKKELCLLLRSNNLILETTNIDPDQAFMLLAMRLAGLEDHLDEDIDELNLEDSEKYHSASDLIEASLIVFS